MIDSASVPSFSDREGFIVSSLAIVESEARRLSWSCRRLDYEDLVGAGSLFVCENADRLMVGENPLAYTRVALRVYFRRYVWRSDSLVKTPLAKDIAPMVCMSLDAPIRADDPTFVLADTLEDRGSQIPEKVARVRELLVHLSKREREALLLRYDGPGGRLRTYAEVAAVLKITRHGACTTVTNALKRLRRLLAVEVAA